MSIFGTIMSKIFGAGAAKAAPSSAAAGGSATAPAPAPSAHTVDVAAILDAMPGASHLNWRESIVDLLKLLDMDSSHAARNELAHELHYEGDAKDSAKMNIWLHKQVMTKLAENGGKLPPGMTHL